MAMIKTPEIQQNVINYFNALGYTCDVSSKFGHFVFILAFLKYIW